MTASQNKKSTVTKCVAFLLLAAVLFVYLNLLVVNKGTIATRGEYESFYELDDNLADVVFVGASNIGSFHIGSVGYSEEGIAGVNIGSSSSPFIFLTSLIDESEISQNPFVYVIDLKRITAADNLTDQQIRLTVDMMDFSSPNRYSMILKAMDAGEVEPGTMINDVDGSALDYLFPVVKYHNRVAQRDIGKGDVFLQFPLNNKLGYSSLKKATNIAPQKYPKFTNKQSTLSDAQTLELNELLEYCDELGKPVVFTSVPFSGKQTEYETLNAAISVVENRGYPVINFNTDKMVDEIGLNFETDYFNSGHVNYRGAEKYTKYMARYLKDNYNLPDRRNDTKYSQWEKASNEYYAWVDKYSG